MKGQFEKGNQFWKLRLKHGRDRVIQSPDELWENFIQYAEWVESNPLEEQHWVGKDGDEVKRYKMRPMLKPEFAVVCGLSEFAEIASLKKVSDDFSQIVRRIESAIASWNITGSAAGFLNPNIIARVEGLSEKTENTHEVKNAPSYEQFLKDLKEPDAK